MQTRRGDGGLDILFENGNEWTVYQCKNYILGKIDKEKRPKQIKDSFNKAVETAAKSGKVLKKWVLCIPRNMDVDEIEWWKAFKIQHKAKCSSFDTIQNNNISEYLLRYPHIFDYFFKRLIPDNLDMFIKIQLRDCIEEFRAKLDRATNPSGVSLPKLSEIEEYGSLFTHIVGLKAKFDDFHTILRNVDMRSKALKSDWEDYNKNKIRLSDRQREARASAIKLKGLELEEYILDTKIEEFKQYLENALENFDQYFSRVAL